MLLETLQEFFENILHAESGQRIVLLNLLAKGSWDALFETARDIDKLVPKAAFIGMNVSSVKQMTKLERYID